jgi:hypothetical protein
MPTPFSVLAAAILPARMLPAISGQSCAQVGQFQVPGGSINHICINRGSSLREIDATLTSYPS